MAGIAFLAAALPTMGGCRTGVRDFAELNDPAPFVRARAAGLDESVSDAEAVPALIAHLDDVDPVVRLSSHESLRERTGQDFGYTPYGAPEDRAAAISRWKSWWSSRGAAQRGPFPGTRPSG